MEAAAGAAVDTAGGAFKKAANFALNRKVWIGVGLLALTGGAAAAVDPSLVPIDLSGLLTTPTEVAEAANAAGIAQPTFWSSAGTMAGNGALAIGGNAVNGLVFVGENIIDWGAEAMAPDSP